MTLREAGDKWHKKRGCQLVASMSHLCRSTRFCDFVVPGSDSATKGGKRPHAAIKLARETPRNARFADDKVEERLPPVTEHLLQDIIGAMPEACCRPGETLKMQRVDADFLRKELTSGPTNCKTREGRVLPTTERLQSGSAPAQTSGDSADSRPA